MFYYYRYYLFPVEVFLDKKNIKVSWQLFGSISSVVNVTLFWETIKSISLRILFFNKLPGNL